MRTITTSLLLVMMTSCAAGDGDARIDDELAATPTLDPCVDQDQDNYCTKASAAAGTRYDCDDARDEVNPGAIEICDGLDNNCDGQIDEGIPAGTPFWPDQDGDGQGLRTASVVFLCGLFTGYADNLLDCDDADPKTYSGACEIEDDKDNDCDGEIDEATNACP